MKRERLTSNDKNDKQSSNDCDKQEMGQATHLVSLGLGVGEVPAVASGCKPVVAAVQVAQRQSSWQGGVRL